MCDGSDVCVTSNGKRQPLFFNTSGVIAYPQGSCSSHNVEGEYFKGVEWVGCAGSNTNSLTFKKGAREQPVTLARGGVLVRVTPTLKLGRYKCSVVNSATNKRKNGDVSSSNLIDSGT
ncbi:hypothetical protein Pcinc_000595 [Petrolisthes cinctipes]|uniref:Uncharacterized protein n=1 Tax=Petrolisthes cinctipes TaxID=88211 RepID=A0AAE1L586_PETCI|nr:hypothetical protein Pcinc_000595 [Petrolisthes cinctipes]